MWKDTTSDSDSQFGLTSGQTGSVTVDYSENGQSTKCYDGGRATMAFVIAGLVAITFALFFTFKRSASGSDYRIPAVSVFVCLASSCNIFINDDFDFLT